MKMQDLKKAGKFTGHAWVERRAGENSLHAIYDKIYVSQATENVLQYCTAAHEIEHGSVKVVYMRRVE